MPDVLLVGTTAHKSSLPTRADDEGGLPVSPRVAIRSETAVCRDGGDGSTPGVLPLRERD